jgi:signal transduction histidine kinase
MAEVTIEDLKKVIALQGLPDDHLQWIIDHSEFHVFADGDRIAKYGEPAETMWIGVEGKVAFYMMINGRQVFYFTFENNHQSGGVGGLLPYSRMVKYPGNSYAHGEMKCLLMNKKWFPELEKLNPAFIQKLIGYMTERARAFATTQLHHEKVNALGVLAAGIAHELNNPAAAINRISNELDKRLKRNYDLTKKMLQCNLTPVHLQQIQTLVEEKEKNQEVVKMTAMQRMNYEDELADWLESKGVVDREPAETLAEFNFTIDELENLLHELGNSNFLLVIPWLENLLSSSKIITDLNDASARISNLVGSIKSHVHMDRTNELQDTDLHKDIENTLILLGFKLREKNIKVIKKFCTDLLPLPAYIGELNQVWTNLIDNAIFAMQPEGELIVETRCNEREVIVSIIDNGPGIPHNIISRIFDPFYTTKKVGEGTGIGLDIVNRIVKRHKGDITVDSEPGKTKFTVCIPISQKQDLIID